MTSFRTCRLCAGVLLLALGIADRAASQTAQPFYWWRSEPVKKDLGLTSDQATRIDSIHQSTLPELRQEWDDFNRCDSKLSRLIETSSDEALLARQIDRVETARANLNKTRSLMLARMRLVLTPDQRARLKVLSEERESQNRRPPAQSPQDSRRPAPDPGKQSSDPNKHPGF
jgi:Spy/CpxP family protein refolding chaperone